MLQNIKENLFTIHGLLTSVLHGLIVVGLLATWVFVNVQVLGNDVAISVPSAETFRGKGR